MSEAQKSSPIAVLISDIHFTINTLTEATASFIQAQQKAFQLNVPLIVCGDTLDTKAIMRAECVNRLLELLYPLDAPKTIFLVGNHDLCNEKSKGHSLNFLKERTTVVDAPQTGEIGNVVITMIPYQSDSDKFLSLLRSSAGLVIAHQGIKAGKSGHYLHDPSAVSPADVAGYRIISGHYHARQDIPLQDGLWSFVGNPYTLTFGEAQDPEKGFQVLNEDGSLIFVPTGLRRHRILEIDAENIAPNLRVSDQDILWLKLSGFSDTLAKWDKKKLAEALNLQQDFKLDKIPTDRTFASEQPSSAEDVLDGVIERLDSPPERKSRLKTIWRRL